MNEPFHSGKNPEEHGDTRKHFVRSIRQSLRKTPSTVMLVDDEASVRRVVRRSLQKMAPGVDIIEAENGQQCLDIIAERDQNKEILPALIVLDLDLPVLDGWQVIEQLRVRSDAGERAIPVIVLSGTSGEKGFLFRKSVHKDKMGYQPMVTIAKDACADCGRYDARGEAGLLAWIEHFLHIS